MATVQTPTVQDHANQRNEYSIYLSNYILSMIQYYNRSKLPAFTGKTNKQLASTAMAIASTKKGNPPTVYSIFQQNLQIMSDDSEDYRVYLCNYIIYSWGGYNEDEIPNLSDKTGAQLASAALGISDAARDSYPMPFDAFCRALAERQELK